MQQVDHAADANAGTVVVQYLRGGSAAHVVVSGEHDLSTVDQLSGTLTDTLESCSHLIVDISTATFIDSSTIRALLAAKGRSDATGRRFNLILGTAPIVERALEITGVLNALNRAHTLDEAFASGQS